MMKIRLNRDLSFDDDALENDVFRFSESRYELASSARVAQPQALAFDAWLSANGQANAVPMLTQLQVDQLEVGFQQTLDAIESNLIAQVFAEKLPLLGDNLVAAAGNGALQLHYLAALRTAIVDLGLNTLNGATDYTELQVEQAINSGLAAAGITAGGAGADLNLANLGDIKLTMSTAKLFAAFDAPLETNLGLPGLGIQTSGTVQSTLNYHFNFGVGLDATGFYLNTASGNSTFSAALDAKVPGFSASAQLGPLRYTASDLIGPNASDFNATFAITLKDADNDGRLRANELGGDLLDAKLNGNAAVGLHLASNLGSAVLPDIAADMFFNWGFGNAEVDPAASQVNFGNAPTLVFKNVSLGLGSFFSDFVSPVFGQLQLLTGPLQPIVDVLKTEIKPISELAGAPVTVLSIAEISGALDQATYDRIDLYLNLINFINSVPVGGGNARIDLGDYNLGGPDLRSPTFQLVDAVHTSLRNALPAGNQSPELQTFLNGKAALPGGGMSFPIIESPATAINLLLGKPVDFFTYHVPGLDFGPKGFDEFYPILGPLGVRLQGTVEAHAHLDVGYDSSGVARFASSGTAADILKGFYVVDQPGPEATLTAHIGAFGAINVVFAEAGVGGGVDANLSIELIDSDSTPGDGRVHLADLNPAACGLFTTSGEIGAGVSAYLKVGWGPFSESFEKNFAHVTLLDFDGLGCDGNGLDGAPVLAHLLGAGVALNVGPDSALRQVGDTQDGFDDFLVFHRLGGPGDETVGVVAGGLRNVDGSALTPQDYHAAAGGRISADGGDKDDRLLLAEGVLTAATLHGGGGDDLLVGSGGWDALFGDAGSDTLIGGIGNDNLNGGADQDYLDGQEGDDSLFGGTGFDQLIGGPGADLLDGGAGFDTVSYVTATVGVVVNLSTLAGSNDAQGDTYVSIERIVGSPFGDILIGSAGGDNLAGGASGDVIDGMGGDDLLTGDAGADQLIGGAGNDFAAYTISPAAVAVSLLTGLGSGGDAEGDTLSGIENLQGSSDFGDTLEGDNQANWLRGLNGNNTLRGLGGNDLLEGGKDDDRIEGGDGNDILWASQDPASIDPASGQTSSPSGGHDTLLGGAGDDILQGDDGGDTLDGGDGADQILGGKDADIIFGGIGDDTAFGGAGDDNLDGGDGADRLLGEAGNDRLQGGAGQDTLSGGDGNDVLDGGDGADRLLGDAGDDRLDGGAGNDQLDGGTGNDVLTDLLGDNQLWGGDGVDSLTTGAGNDQLDGGIGNDTLSSGAGDDTLIGGEGHDVLDGGIGSDRVDGGAGNDLLSVGALRGPVQDTNRLDHLFGGAGFDTITADFSNQTLAIAVVAGQTQSLAFADGAEARDFENVHDLFTGSGDDVLRLDGAADDGFANLLKTGAGNDTIYAGGGSDDVDAGDGDDFVHGGFNDAVLTFELGFGTVTGFTGPAETLAGGAGVDTLSFEGFYGAFPANVALGVRFGVAVNLATNQTGGAATGIVISGFENIVGTDYGDELIGNDAANTFEPLRGGGNTHSVATSGPDRIDGGGGEDLLRIDFSRADLANSLGVVTNGGTIYRNTIGNIDVVDSYIYINVEHLDITGASKNDSLYANVYGFSDRLSGLGGNDILGGFGGADTLLGGDGNDVLTAQGQFAVGYNGAAGEHDVLDGGAGDDLVEDIGFIGNFPALGANALFQLDGGSGFDTLSADFSNQTVAIVWDSAAATDVAFADGAYFRNFEALRYFASGSGDDRITQGGRVNNLFYLGAGNDTVNPGLGVDTVEGGAGIDTVVLDYSVGDSAEMAGVVSSGEADGGTYFRPMLADYFNRPDYVLLRGVERVQITGSSKNDNLVGTYGDDRLIGGDGNDVLDGNRGGNNWLDGGNGDDLLRGSYGIDGTGANDMLIGGAGNDTLLPLTGSDTALGGSGNDTITATDFPNDGYGVDWFDGGDGDDVVSDGLFSGGNSFTNAATRLHLDGGAGFDRLSADFGNQTEAIIFIAGQTNSFDFADGSYFRNFEALGFLTAGSGNDRLILAGREDNSLASGAGNDTVNPGLGIDYANGGAGDDLLIVDYSASDAANLSGAVFGGSTGERRDVNTNALVDSLFFNQFERYQITGGSKDDWLVGGSGPAVLIGNAGNDRLTGGDSDDVLLGGIGDDILSGGNGADLLDGGAGTDTLIGGRGNDTYYVDRVSDITTEFAGEGTDTVYTAIDHALAANIENLVLSGTAARSGTGNALNNILTGNAIANTMNGGDGNDTLVGLGGNDTLLGGNGADRLRGGSGRDTLTGGADSDRFVFDTVATAANVDTVTDFAVGSDTIGLSNAAYAGLGAIDQALSASLFAAGSGLIASPDATARIVFDTTTGRLFYDADGAGGLAAVQIATLQGSGLAGLSAASFWVEGPPALSAELFDPLGMVKPSAMTAPVRPEEAGGATIQASVAVDALLSDDWALDLLLGASGSTDASSFNPSQSTLSVTGPAMDAPMMEWHETHQQTANELLRQILASADAATLALA